MKFYQSSFSPLQAVALIACACLAIPVGAWAQGVWNNDDDRDYYGTPPMLGTPLWSYGYVAQTQNTTGHVGNWGGVAYPGSGGVTNAVLGAPANTNCDVQVSLSSLTINPGGQLLMDWSSALTVASTNVATDGTLAFNMNGGGAFPIFTNAGTFRKSAGNGSYSIDSAIVFESLPGSVIQVDSGSLQLPGIDGLFDTATFNTAAGTLIDLVADRGNGDGRSLFQGTLTNTTGVGTVRLRANTMRVGNTGQALTLNFPGNVFQWVSGVLDGSISSTAAINAGTMNLSGSDTKYCQSPFTNKNLMIQSGAGNLDIYAYTVTNAAGATYDLQSDAGIVTTYYGAFANTGLFKKSAGTGTSTINTYFSHLGGTVEVDSGTLLLPTVQHLGTNISTGGAFNVAANALLDLGNGEAFGGTYTGSGAGTVQMNAGVMPLDINNNYPTTFNFPAGLFQWTGGTIGNSSGELFTNQGTLTLSGDASKTFSAIVTNTGTITVTGAGGSAGSGGSFTNAAGALWDLRSDAGITTGNLYALPFSNAGTLQKSGGTGTSTMNLLFTNTGQVLVKTGTMDFTGTLTGLSGSTLTQGIWEVDNNATLSFSNYPNGITVNQAAVVLNGANAQFPPINPITDNQGTFSLLALRQFTTAGALSNEGTIFLDAGSTLHVGGNFTASDAAPAATSHADRKHVRDAAVAASKLHFTIGGTANSGAQSPGVLQVAGVAKMAGLMEIALAELAATPGAGDTLTILSASSVTGAFDNAPDGTRLATADGRGSFVVTYGTSSIGLSRFLATGQTESTPTVTIAVAGDGDAVEGGENGKVAIRRDGDTTNALVVRYKVAGGVKAGTDYKALPGVVTIPAGAAQVKVKIKAVNDSTPEGTRVAKIKLKPAADGSYVLGTSVAAKVKIIDND